MLISTLQRWRKRKGCRWKRGRRTIPVGHFWKRKRPRARNSIKKWRHSLRCDRIMLLANQIMYQAHINMLTVIDVLLLDIEGTITDIAFVRNVLFPYVRQHLREYLEQKWDSEELKADIEAIRLLANTELQNGDHHLLPIPPSQEHQPTLEKDTIVDAVVNNVNRWMDLDKKTGPLKQLQGHMWRDAYETGQIKGHLYPDVVPSLRRLLLENKNTKAYIYSSGSVLAQKLLFTYSCDGNVTELFTGYFDTYVGAKTKTESYKRIADEIGVPPSRILFLTDVEREAYPARNAGCKVGLVVRSGNEPLTEQAKTHYPIYSNLEEVLKSL